MTEVSIALNPNRRQDHSMSLTLPSNCDDALLHVAAEIEKCYVAASPSNVNSPALGELPASVIAPSGLDLERVRLQIFQILEMNSQSLEARFLAYRYLYITLESPLNEFLKENGLPTPVTDADKDNEQWFPDDWQDQEALQGALADLKSGVSTARLMANVLPQVESIDRQELGWEYLQSMLCLLFDRANLLAARIDSSPEGRRLFAFDLWRFARGFFKNSLAERYSALVSSEFGHVHYKFPIIPVLEESPQFEAASIATSLLEGETIDDGLTATAVLIDLHVLLGRLNRAAALLEKTEVSIDGLMWAGQGRRLSETFDRPLEFCEAFISQMLTDSTGTALSLAGRMYLQSHEYDKVLSSTQVLIDRNQDSSAVHYLRFEALVELAKYQEAAAEFAEAIDRSDTRDLSPADDTLVVLGKLARESPEYFRPIRERLEEVPNFKTQRNLVRKILEAHWQHSLNALRETDPSVEEHWVRACVYLFGRTGIPEEDRSEEAFTKVSRCVERALKGSLGIPAADNSLKLHELVARFEDAATKAGIAGGAPTEYLGAVRVERNKSFHEDAQPLEKAIEHFRYAVNVIREVAQLRDRTKKRRLPGSS